MTQHNTATSRTFLSVTLQEFAIQQMRRTKALAINHNWKSDRGVCVKLNFYNYAEKEW